MFESVKARSTPAVAAVTTIAERPKVVLLAVSLGLLAALAAPAHAVFPGPNGRVAFSRFSYDPILGYFSFNVWAANPDGTAQQQLTHLPGGTTVRDWSPDGRRVLFDYGDADGNIQLATVNADGTGFHVVTAGAFLHEMGSYSRDGARILFDAAPAPPSPETPTTLWEMNADGTGAHQLLAPPPGMLDSEPRLSPDGRQIAFVRVRKTMGGERNQQNAIFVMRADATGVHQLTPWGENAEHPDWSPDGSRIVFNDKTLSSAGSESIATIRPDGTSRQQLLQLPANADAYKPRYSPDGTRLAFGCGTARDEDICTMHADGSHVADITNTPFYLDGSGFEDAAAWGTAPLH